MTVKDLKALSKALKKDEQEIRIEDPALTELVILSSPNLRTAKKVLKGSGIGAAIAGAGVALSVFSGGLLLPIAGLATAGVGLFKMGKAATVDAIAGMQEDKDLIAAQNEIAKKYKGLNMGEVFDLMNRYYKETSKGNSYSVFTHK